MADQRNERVPAHPPTPQGMGSIDPQRYILMSPHMATIGGLLAFFVVVAMVVVLPTATYDPPPSDNWLPLSDAAVRGRGTFLANGCIYCHSGFSRPQDVANGQYYLYPRVSEPGDYNGVSPNLFGSERTGPDLSQEGGMHADDWHHAHYANPRNTIPFSVMPRFDFWDEATRDDAIAFNQAQGGKEAVLRYATISVGDQLNAIGGGTLDPVDAFPDLVAEMEQQGIYRADGSAMDLAVGELTWNDVWGFNGFQRSYWLTHDPLPLTQPNLVRGKQIFLQRCSGCHGAKGDGNGVAAKYLSPQPFDFTDPDNMSGPCGSDGMFYHRILTGGKGSAMEAFGTRLSIEDAWRVVLFLRTIQHGSLATEDTVPTVDMWEGWTPPPGLTEYIDDHPIGDASGVLGQPGSDPFASAASWVAPGMAPGDEILLGGKMPMTLKRVTQLINDRYFSLINEAYDDALARGDDLPPRDQIYDTSSLVFRSLA